MNKQRISRRQFVHGSTAALAAGATGIAVVGCGGSEPDNGLTQVDFLAILDPEGLTFAPELMAIAGGYFADQGLEVTLQRTRGSAPAINTVIAGGAPLTRIEQVEGVVHLANRGVPIRNVGTVIKQSAIRFLSSEAAPIRSPEDFVGKLIGIPSEGGSTDRTLDLLVAAAGIDPESIERQVVGTAAGNFDLIERGTIHAFAASIDVANILSLQRDNAVVLNPGDFIASGAQFYMMSEDGLAEHGDTARRYLQAVDGAIQFMIDDSGFDRTLEILRQEFDFATLQNTEVAKASLGTYVDIWTAEGRENVLRTVDDSWVRGYQELVQAGLADGGFEPRSWYTNELVPTRA